ncbi:MAG: hypothetical protein OXU64_03455 [Gemmatimonadota bacterium]|nr:hypothetical protein [Gemmatimonadota bacterium]
MAVAKTAREALKALEPAQPYTVDAATWDPGEAPEAVVSVTTSGDWAHPAMRRGEAAALGGAGGSGKSYLALDKPVDKIPPAFERRGIRAGPAPRRSRCSGGFIHALLGVLPAQRDLLPVPRIVPPYEPFRSL